MGILCIGILYTLYNNYMYYVHNNYVYIVMRVRVRAGLCCSVIVYMIRMQLYIIYNVIN